MTDIIHYASPLGDLLLAGAGGCLTGLWIEGQKYYPEFVRNEIRMKETPVLTQSKLWLDRYFAGEKPAIDELKLLPRGSSFQKIVWELLCKIPYGEVTTYGILAGKTAARMGKGQMSAQAVGGAVGHNPISIIIPCHRVVGANGSLTGYAGGIDRKAKLLAYEGVDMTRLFTPQTSRKS